MTIPDAAPLRSRGKDVLVEFPQDELIAKWEEFFEESGYLSKIIAIADRYPEERSLPVVFDELNRFDTDMAIYLLRHPLNVLMAGEEAIRRLVPPGEELAQIHLRVKFLPRDRRVPIRDLRAKHLGQFIAVEGLVRKSTEVRPRVTDALFQCLRCGTIIKESQDGQNFREPLECYEEQGGCKRSASATKFKLMTEGSLYLDTQKLEIQEAPEGLRGGEEPQRLTLYVEDDLTGRITPGQRVIFSGILRSVQKGRPGAKSTLFDIFMDANSMEQEQVEFEEIEVTEEDARLIREAGSSPDIFRLMVSSIAPSIYGLPVEKEALALQLFSGVPKTMPDGRRIRGDIHVLLVGDPGTAKSELLSYMSRLSPRGIYATGRAASGAGLTAVATRDEFGEGRWTLEAGALVLADRGLACLDELDKMNPQDRSAIHEALEQQRISVAKAGITAVLQARCSVLAAANPKFGRFDEHKYISEQIDLPPTLLSRFDIIFSMIDRPEAEKDRQLAEHILRGHQVGEISKRREEGASTPEVRALEEPYLPYFSPDFLRKYVAYAKRIYPVMADDAIAIIEKKYLDIRKTGEGAGSSVPITPRQLEAIIRLSEAGARLRLSDTVTGDDAERAVRIVEYWMGKVAGEEGRFDIDIIQTGISQSQREQIISIRDIINELAGPEGVADYEDIVRIAQERGIPPARVDAWLKRWAQEGEIYSPAKNKYKLVERL
ncbi:MAG TPA: minichromosome maintenance protein MCM [Thermoplasmata archaeon]|nr:minichromosome maintenance protein MCM [Thermoplasmata archaeon]